MKKLFFAALVAVAAVSGAYASGPYYLLDSDEQIFCNGDLTDCATVLGGDADVYTTPASAPGPQTGQIRLSQIPADFN